MSQKIFEKQNSRQYRDSCCSFIMIKMLHDNYQCFRELRNFFAIVFNYQRHSQSRRVEISLNYRLKFLLLSALSLSGKKLDKSFLHRDEDDDSRLPRSSGTHGWRRRRSAVAPKARRNGGPVGRSRHCARVRPSARTRAKTPSAPILRYAEFTHPHSAPRGDRTWMRAGREHLYVQR